MSSHRRPERPSEISAVILARNEEANMRACLETLRWCDEIIVVDMDSEDGTAAIAREYTPHVHRHERIPAFDIAKRFGVGKATGDWILIVDADEMIPRPLASTLAGIASAGDCDVVEVPFKHYMIGDWVRHSGWGHTPLPRFFRRGMVHFRDTVHQYMVKDDRARTRRLEPSDGHCIHHFAYTDFSHFIDKLNRYTSIEAGQMRGCGKRFSYGGLLAAAARQFFGRYVKGKGYRDGVKGFALCLMMAFYKAAAFAKLWELEEFSEDPVAGRYDRIRRGILANWEAASPPPGPAP